MGICEYNGMVFEEEFSGRRLGGRPEYFKGVRGMTKKFLSITRTAQATGISTSTLRRWLAEGRLPGFYSGSWFYVNCEELEEMISAGVFSQPHEVRG